MRSGGPAVGPGVASIPGPRFAYLDGIRALAALFVIVHHSWLAVFPAFPRNSGPWWVGWMLYGHMAVSVFIVVSGFSLTIGPARRGMHLPGTPGQFLARRAWRILPTYWAALVLTCVVYGVVTARQTGASVNPKAIVVHALLLQDVVNSTKPNGAFWSIAVEWQIYFLFPAMLLLCRRYGSRRAFACVAALVLVGYELAIRFTAFERFLNITPQYVVLFAMGVLAASLLGRARPPRRATWLAPAAALLALTFVLLCWGLGSVWIASHFFWMDLLVGAAIAALIGALALGRAPRVADTLGGRTLAGVGAYSYSIYLIHAPLLWLVWHFFVARLDIAPIALLAVLLATVTPVALVVSWAFYRIFERPFLTRRSWSAWAALLRGLALRPTAPATAESDADQAVDLAAASDRL